jgi:predicted HTH transcriptional regulator
MNQDILIKVEETENENAELDFKAAFDPTASQDWCELIKDVVAMANSGGGIVVFGVNDDGTPASGNLQPIQSLDPATFVDKIKGIQISTSGTYLYSVQRGVVSQLRFSSCLQSRFRWYSPLPAHMTSAAADKKLLFR